MALPAGRCIPCRPLGRVRLLAALPARRSLLTDWSVGGPWWVLSVDPQASPPYDGFVRYW
jgi:hypothetical protein